MNKPVFQVSAIALAVSLTLAPIHSNLLAADTQNNITEKMAPAPLIELSGVNLGSRALAKDRFNRVDPRCLVALHGNPTVILVSSAPKTEVTVLQQPPHVSQLIRQGEKLPNWAKGVAFPEDKSHVVWLYQGKTSLMSFQINRKGIIEAITVRQP